MIPFTEHSPEKDRGEQQVITCQGHRVGECIKAKRLQQRAFSGDGTVLYPDCGGGYMNL